MGAKRGRRSIADLTTTLIDVSRGVRPDAPYELTDEEADEWRAVVERCPANWFPRETHGLLVAYCRHVVGQRRLSQLVFQHETGEPGQLITDAWLERYDALLRMREREGRALSSLATRLRISQQATVDARKHKGRGAGVKAPWET